MTPTSALVGTALTQTSFRSESVSDDAILGRLAGVYTVGCKSFPDFVEPVDEIPVNRYNRPYHSPRKTRKRPSASAAASKQARTTNSSWVDPYVSTAPVMEAPSAPIPKMAR